MKSSAPYALSILHHIIVRLTALLLVSILLLLAVSARAQDISSTKEGFPAAPKNLILDDAGLFREKPADLAAMSDKLRKIEQEGGYPVYLVIYYNVFGVDLSQRATDLYHEWLGDGRQGIVVVYQLDPIVNGDNPAVGYYQGSRIDEEAERGVIPSVQMKAMVADALDAIKDSESPHDEKLNVYIDQLSLGVIGYHKIKTPGWAGKEDMGILIYFAIAVAVFGLLVIILWKLMGKSDAKSNQTFFLPEVKVGRRLGAHYGGGWVSERSFVSSSARK